MRCFFVLHYHFLKMSWFKSYKDLLKTSTVNSRTYLPQNSFEDMSMNCRMSFAWERTSLNLSRPSIFFTVPVSAACWHVFIGCVRVHSQNMCAHGWGLICNTKGFWSVCEHFYKQDPSSIVQTSVRKKEITKHCIHLIF